MKYLALHKAVHKKAHKQYNNKPGHRWLEDAQATPKPHIIGTQQVALVVSINQVPKSSI